MLTEHGAEVIVPVIEPHVVVRRVPSDTDGTAPIFHNAPESRRESAWETLVERKAVRVIRQRIQCSLVKLIVFINSDFRAVAPPCKVGDFN